MFDIRCNKANDDDHDDDDSLIKKTKQKQKHGFLLGLLINGVSIHKNLQSAVLRLVAEPNMHRCKSSFWFMMCGSGWEIRGLVIATGTLGLSWEWWWCQLFTTMEPGPESNATQPRTHFCWWAPVIASRTSTHWGQNCKTGVDRSTNLDCLSRFATLDWQRDFAESESGVLKMAPSKRHSRPGPDRTRWCDWWDEDRDAFHGNPG